ncbi:MAG: hypothetical protein J6C41_03030 [Oscillospiraceae bacterium]|nr:hypothetical protein [Oscillospiraceae bacterium]
MNHICVRRIALAMASLSFGLLVLIVLGCNVWRVHGMQTAENSVCEAKQERIIFPYTALDAGVIIENIGVYEGIFHEDDTNRQVFDVAAIMLCNSADRVISYIAVELKTDGGLYLFEGFMLPPKSRIFIPEKNAQKMIEKPILSCDINVEYLQNRADDAVLIEERDWDTLCITNLSDTVLPYLTIYYHHYLPEDGVYIGGKAFETTVWNLQPGVQTQLSPMFYCKGYSKITLVE